MDEGFEPQTEREMLLLLGQSIGRMEVEITRLADHVKTQNGRVGKLETKQLEQLSYDAGRASLRKSDLAWLATLLAVGSTLSGIIQRFV